MSDEKGVHPKKLFPYRARPIKDLLVIFAFLMIAYIGISFNSIDYYAPSNSDKTLGKIFFLFICTGVGVAVLSLRRWKEEKTTAKYLNAVVRELSEQTKTLLKEIDDRRAAEANLLAAQKELLNSNAELEKAVLQANDLAAKVKESNQELIHEIQERKSAEKALRASEETYRLITQNATDMIWTVDMQRRFTFTSPSAFHLLGYSPQELMHMSIDDVLTHDSLETAKKIIAQEFDRTIRGDHSQPEMLATQIELRRKDGTIIWAEVNTRFISDCQRRITGILGVTRDINERKKAERELLYMAHHDALTGLLNRKAFIERLGTEIERAGQQQYELILIFLDLDNYKRVNDTLGHEKGDKLLVSVAKRLKAIVREMDLVARLGGDEFTLLIKNPDGHFREVISNRLVEHLNRPFHIEGEIIDFISASIGIAHFPDHGSTAEDLLRRADFAMYEAKNNFRQNAGVLYGSAQAKANFLKPAQIAGD